MDQDDQYALPGGNTGENTEPVGEVIPPAPRYPNLRPPWAKGQSGNRKGRPQTKPLTDALRRQLSKKVPVEMLADLTKKSDSILKVIGKRPTYADLLAWAHIQQGLKGNVGALARLYDRIEGRIPREASDSDDGQLDDLMAVLAMGPVPPGEVNE